jgi:hypothetical protein
MKKDKEIGGTELRVKHKPHRYDQLILTATSKPLNGKA